MRRLASPHTRRSSGPTPPLSLLPPHPSKQRADTLSPSPTSVEAAGRPPLFSPHICRSSGQTPPLSPSSTSVAAGRTPLCPPPTSVAAAGRPTPLSSPHIRRAPQGWRQGQTDCRAVVLAQPGRRQCCSAGRQGRRTRRRRCSGCSAGSQAGQGRCCGAGRPGPGRRTGRGRGCGAGRRTGRGRGCGAGRQTGRRRGCGAGRQTGRGRCGRRTGRGRCCGAGGGRGADGAAVREADGARTGLWCGQAGEAGRGRCCYAGRRAGRGMRGPDLGSARELELVGGTDLTIRRIKRTHELGRLITASETKGSIRSAPNFACTCMRAKE